MFGGFLLTGCRRALDKKYNERSSRSASANHEPRRPDDEVTVQSKPGAARKGRGKGSSRAGLWCQAGWRYWLAALPTEPFDQRPITPAAAERGFCLFSTRYEVGMRKMRLQPERRGCFGCRRPSRGVGVAAFTSPVPIHRKELPGLHIGCVLAEAVWEFESMEGSAAGWRSSSSREFQGQASAAPPTLFSLVGPSGMCRTAPNPAGNLESNPTHR